MLRLEYHFVARQFGAYDSEDESLVEFLRLIIGVGGGAIAATVIGTGAGAAEDGVVLLLSMFTGCILGGLAPVVGFYAGVGALLAPFVYLATGGYPPIGWLVSILVGMVFGITQLLLAGRSVPLAPNADEPPGGRRHWRAKELGPSRRRRPRLVGPIVSLVVLGPIVGAGVGRAIAGPLAPKFYLFYACVALGAVIGLALFAGCLTAVAFESACDKWARRARNGVSEH